MNELANVRVLEIGPFRFSKARLPDQTTLVWTGLKPFRPPEDVPGLSALNFIGLWRRLVRGDDDVVVVYVEQWAPWHWKNLRRLVSLRPLSVALRLLFVQLIRFIRPKKPLIVIDLTEWGFIHRYNEFLLDKCTLYFKRELPYDYWRVFRRSSGGGIPATRFRSLPRNRSRVEKLRPLSIGSMMIRFDDIDAFPDKSSEVFVAVTTQNSATLRAEGMRQLETLRERGVGVDIVEGRLDKERFKQRMAQAWLTWSPHGFGWDCFRHYEAPLAFSVPVISAPTSTRLFPLIDGEHCFYYTPDEPDSLARTIERALADKARLRRMAEAARALVMRYHVWPERIERFLAMGLGLEEAPGAVSVDKSGEGGPWWRTGRP